LSIVVDSNLLIRAATDRATAVAVRERFFRWRTEGQTLHAPWLFRYEVADALARYVSVGEQNTSEAASAWADIERSSKSITFHDISDGARVIAIAQTLRRQNAYDAAYIALAEELETDVWTLDGPLARNAAQTGLPVKLIEIQ
jgi:predicted nucleic acid-binding protein